MSQAIDRSIQPKAAVWALIIGSGLVLLGIHFAFQEHNQWRMLLLSGRPVTVRFVCGTPNVLNCKDSFVVSYSGETLCEHVKKNDEPADLTGWCNGNPAENSFSITGAVFRFDRGGVVRLASNYVGQLFEQ